MDVSGIFELVLGDDILELVTDECQNATQVNAALVALTTTHPQTLQLPTPPPSPPLVEVKTHVQTEYISPRWSQRLKLPKTVFTVDQTLADARIAPLERLPRDIFWLILSQPSFEFPAWPLLDRYDHISLLLASKSMACKYFQLFPRFTTALERRKLIIFDRIAAPMPRRVKKAQDPNLLLDSPANSVFERCENANVARLKRPRSYSEDTDGGVAAHTQVLNADAAHSGTESGRKRRRISRSE